MTGRIAADHLGGALIALIGAGVVVEGSTYDVGSLTEMGPGFFPVVLGVILLVVGGLIALTAARTAHASAPEEAIHPRSLLCIAAGVLLFIVLSQYGGLLPASFAAVFVSALGDRTTAPGRAFLLALAVSVAGAGLFHYGLGLQLPLFAWSGR